MRARLLRRESGGDSGPSAPGLELVSLCASLSSAWMRARSHCASPLLLSCPDPSGPSLRVNGPAAAPPPPSLLHSARQVINYKTFTIFPALGFWFNPTVILTILL